MLCHSPSLLEIVHCLCEISGPPSCESFSISIQLRCFLNPSCPFHPRRVERRGWCGVLGRRPLLAWACQFDWRYRYLSLTPSLGLYFLNHSLRKKILTHFKDRNYLWTGKLSPRAYDADCVFTDPTLSFKGSTKNWSDTKMQR